MHILIAPNAFKGSLSSFEVAHIMAKAFQEVWPQTHLTQLPVADGGDGTAQVLARQLGAIPKEVIVQNPIGRHIQAPIYVTPDRTAIIELANASGIRLLQTHEYDPMQASTFGTGQLIKAALDEGCKRLIIGIGGSATNDCGIGILRALGVKFLDRKGKLTASMLDFASVDLSQLDTRLQDSEIIVPCDVQNPLVGPQGAANIFGPQKGANTQQVEALATAHQHFADLINRQFGVKLHDMPFTGAAGGTAAGLFAILQAKLVKGSAFMLDELGFDEVLQTADIVLTGEGQIDAQTASGKAPFEVAMRAKKAGKPVITLGGAIPLQLPHSPDHAAFSICHRPMQLAEALQQAEDLLFMQACNVARLLKIGYSVDKNL